ncbi:hypothetical protein ACB092_02G125800 [Castanea dentata]
MGDSSGNDRGVGGRMSDPGHGCGVGEGMVVGLEDGCGTQDMDVEWVKGWWWG